MLGSPGEGTTRAAYSTRTISQENTDQLGWQQRETGTEGFKPDSSGHQTSPDFVFAV